MTSRCRIFVQAGALQMAVLSLAAHAVYAWESLIPGSRYTSARTSALGGASLPLGEDGNAALFENPADIGKNKGTHLEADVEMATNAGTTDNFGLNSYKTYSLSSNLPQLQAAPGSYQGMAGQLAPTFFGKDFALGMLMSDDIGAMTDASGNVRYRTLEQFIPAAAVGVRLAGGIVRVGYSAQWVDKAVGDLTVPTSASPLGYNQGLAEGSGLSHTIGAALTLPVAYLPQFDLVARNVGGTSYTGPSLIPFAQNKSGAPASDPTTFDVSFSVKPKIDRGIYANWVAELRDMTNRSGMSEWERLCTGLEFSIRDVVQLRVGYGEEYPSAGLGVRFNKKSELDLTWYSEDIGTPTMSQRDIRFMFQYQMRAF